MENEERNDFQNKSDEGFGSKKTSIILIIIILLLLIITAFVMLSGGKSDKELVAVPPPVESDDFETLSPFVTEGLSYEGYDEDISTQYEEYIKEKNDSKNTETKDEPTKPNKGNNNSSNGGNKGNSNNNGSGNGGSSNGGNSGGNGSGLGNEIVLPPINIGGGNPTVPKLPDDNKPPVTDPTKPVDPPVTEPTDPSKPTDPVKPPVTDPTDPSKPTDPVKPPVTDPTDPSKPTDPVGPPDQGNGEPFGEVEVFDRPQVTIDTSDHPAMTDNESMAKYGGSMIGTTYMKNFNILPVSSVKDGAGAIYTFDIYNKSNSVMNITIDHLKILYAGSEDNGYLGKSTYSIQPKTADRVTLIAHSTNTNIVLFEYGGESVIFTMGTMREASDDTTPYDNGYTLDDDGVNYPIKGLVTLNGNSEFKAEILGIKATDLTTLKNINAGSKGSIGLVKVKITNTSSKPLKITGADLFSYSGGTNKESSKVTFSASEFSILGGAAFPTSIPAKGKVYGYVPFYMKDGNHTADVAIKLENESGKKFNAYVRDAGGLPLIKAD